MELALFPLSPRDAPHGWGVVQTAPGAQLVEGWGEGNLVQTGGISSLPNPLPKGEGTKIRWIFQSTQDSSLSDVTFQKMLLQLLPDFLRH